VLNTWTQGKPQHIVTNKPQKQEARRIRTPPMSESTPTSQGRGFFFDFSPPTNESEPEGQSPLKSANTTAGSYTLLRSRTEQRTAREWWEAAKKHRGIGNKSTIKSPSSTLKDEIKISPFELNLPEHLTNSPLCPKNPRHTSGGTGVCVYHGRRRSVGLKQLKRNSTDRVKDN
jgi:parafibromin